MPRIRRGGEDPEPDPDELTEDEEAEILERMSSAGVKVDKAEISNKKPLDAGKIRALREAGWSLSKIADEMGVSAQTIANRLKDMGLK